MPRPKNLPVDDVLPGDAVDVFTESPSSLYSGIAGPISQVNGRHFLQLVEADRIEPTLIPTANICRIERRKKCWWLRKDLPTARQIINWPVKENA